MPATRLDPKRQRDPLREVIAGRMVVAGVSTSELGKHLGWGRTSSFAKIKNPEQWSLEELKKACRFLNISVDELRQAIRY